MNDNKKQSVISERMGWLKNKTVSVKVENGSTFNAQYVDILPLGKSYFFVFNTEGRARMVDTSKVIELIQQ